MNNHLTETINNTFFSTYDYSVGQVKPTIRCGNVFRALSVALIEYLHTYTFLSSTLVPFAQAYFKKYPVNFLSIHAASILGQLRDTMRQTKALDPFVNQMATIFYQLTLQGLLQNPTRYHEFALPPETREYPAHWIAQSAPAVIAELLKVNICVHHTASGKPLHATTYYQAPSKTAVPLHFHLTERHGMYGVYVTQTDKFESLTCSNMHHPNDAVLLEKLLPELDKAIQTTLSKFNNIYHRLSEMAKAGELTKPFLMQLYIEALNHDHSHGTQAFFDSIHLQEELSGGHVSVELLKAIARMVCLNIINENMVFERIESPAVDRSADLPTYA